MRTKIIIIGLFCFLLSACITDCTCENEMDDIRDQYGNPEEKNTYSSSDYKSETWWYWSKGRSYTFEWGSSVEGDCEVSTYTFDPISANSSKELKAEAKNSMKLVNKKITFCNRY